MYWPLDAHHGTDYLDLPVLRRITEALVQGVDLHAVSLAQHFPEEGWIEAEPRVSTLERISKAGNWLRPSPSPLAYVHSLLLRHYRRYLPSLVLAEKDGQERR